MSVTNTTIRGNIIVKHQRGEDAARTARYRFSLEAENIGQFKIMAKETVEGIKDMYREDTVKIDWEFESIG